MKHIKYDGVQRVVRVTRVAQGGGGVRVVTVARVTKVVRVARVGRGVRVMTVARVTRVMRVVRVARVAWEGGSGL